MGKILPFPFLRGEKPFQSLSQDGWKEGFAAKNFLSGPSFQKLPGFAGNPFFSFHFLEEAFKERRVFLVEGPGGPGKFPDQKVSPLRFSLFQ